MIYSESISIDLILLVIYWNREHLNHHIYDFSRAPIIGNCVLLDYMTTDPRWNGGVDWCFYTVPPIDLYSQCRTVMAAPSLWHYPYRWTSIFSQRFQQSILPPKFLISFQFLPDMNFILVPRHYLGPSLPWDFTMDKPTWQAPEHRF